MKKTTKREKKKKKNMTKKKNLKTKQRNKKKKKKSETQKFNNFRTHESIFNCRRCLLLSGHVTLLTFIL